MSEPNLIYHPSLYFNPSAGIASVGIIDAQHQHVLIGVKDAKLFITQQALTHPAPYAYPPLANRWDATDRDRYLKGPKEFFTGPPVLNISGVLGQVRSVLQDYVEFTRTEHASLVACWIVATYFFPLFPTFARLNLNGERGSGKSKLLQLITEMAFNGLLRLNPTPAVLFRLIEPLRPTFCLDEMEGLASGDKNQILSLINAGYKAGAAIDRVEGEAEHRRVVSYQVYAPMALGSIAGLNGVTADRCITLIMQRGQDRAKINRVVDPADPVFAQVRAACYPLALSYFRHVRHAWETLEAPAWLVARQRELYSPLLALATLASREGDPSFRDDLLRVAEAELRERGGASLDAEALLQLLELRLNVYREPSLDIRPGALREEMEKQLGSERGRPVTPEQIGQILQRLGFSRKRINRGTVYTVSRDQLTAVCIRLGYPPPEFSPPPSPVASKLASAGPGSEPLDYGLADEIERDSLPV